MKRGGRLYYITCSVLSEENIEQIRRFLNRQDSDFDLVKRETIMPQIDGNDGFFLAVLEKTK